MDLLAIMLVFTAVIKISYIFISSNKILKGTSCLSGLDPIFLLYISPEAPFWAVCLLKFFIHFALLCNLQSYFQLKKSLFFLQENITRYHNFRPFNNSVLGTRLSVLVCFLDNCFGKTSGDLYSAVHHEKWMSDHNHIFSERDNINDQGLTNML